MAAARYVVVHREAVTIAKRPTSGGPPVVVNADPGITVGQLDQSAEPCTVPIGIAPYDVFASPRVTEVHAIQFPSTTDPATLDNGQAALDEARAKGYPIGSADASSVNGQTITLDIPGMVQTTEGTQDEFLVIAGFDR
jgi:hypothetical protein